MKRTEERKIDHRRRKWRYSQLSLWLSSCVAWRWPSATPHGQLQSLKKLLEVHRELVEKLLENLREQPQNVFQILCTWLLCSRVSTLLTQLAIIIRDVFPYIDNDLYCHSRYVFWNIQPIRWLLYFKSLFLSLCSRDSILLWAVLWWY